MAPHALQNGFQSTLGVILAIFIVIAGCSILYGIYKEIKNYYKNRGAKAKFVIDNWDKYIKKGYFEELALLNKYKEQIKKGEWPDELNDKFEWSEFGNACSTDEDGSIYYYKKTFLTLKNKYKKKEKKEPEAKEENKEDDK